MVDTKMNARASRRLPWLAIGIVCLLILFVLMVVKSNHKNSQTMMPGEVNICFEGEYSIGGGEWNKIEKNKHIPSTHGDVTLRGSFKMISMDGEYLGPVEKGTSIAFLLDHVKVRIYESGEPPRELFDNNSAENSAVCGEIWLTYILQGETDDPVEIVVHNPHSYGNETAADTLLLSISLWTGTDFGTKMLEKGAHQRYFGLFFCAVAIVLLCVAFLSTILRLQKERMVWLVGLITFFSGVYITYSSKGTYFWSEQIEVNTAVIGVSMMYYMLFWVTLIAFLSSKTKRLVRIVALLLGMTDAVLILLPFFIPMCFYDTHFAWVIAQTVADGILIGCLIKESVIVGLKKKFTYIGMILPLLAFEIDAVATAYGFWKGGIVSICVFSAVFLSTLTIALLVIPKNVLAVKKAEELELQRRRLESEKNAIEAELKESRISIMLSQIQPHFIYNTLGTIERLCLKDPQMAFELVRNFSLYLRGNFSELDSVAPICFSEEIKHVQYYINIEKVRFPDITIEYQLDVSDFFLPAISVQPLVENAIKHGLMPLEAGGKVVIRSYETDTHFCVEVLDNGVGFDTDRLINKKEHVGLYNIRERLKAIVNGDLKVESAEGIGTTATILIPKEETL